MWALRILFPPINLCCLASMKTADLWVCYPNKYFYVSGKFYCFTVMCLCWRHFNWCHCMINKHTLVIQFVGLFLLFCFDILNNKDNLIVIFNDFGSNVSVFAGIVVLFSSSPSCSTQPITCHGNQSASLRWLEQLNFFLWTLLTVFLQDQMLSRRTEHVSLILYFLPSKMDKIFTSTLLTQAICYLLTDILIKSHF